MANAEQNLPGKIGNRWTIAAAGVVIMLLLGTVYAWSVFKKPIMDGHGWSGPDVGLTFTLLIFFNGLAAAFGGRFVDRAGARSVATISAVLFGLATVLAGLADWLDSKYLLWLGYGVLGGIGVGLGYITPIAVLTRWFPDKRGLVTGLAVMGFGLGAALTGQFAPILILKSGVANTFYLLGAIIWIVLLPAARKLNNPPEGWRFEKIFSGSSPAVKTAESMDLKSARKTSQLYLLWGILFINVTAGIALISNLSPLAQCRAGLTAVQAGTLVFVCSLFNGFGRIFWPALSDKIGRKTAFLLLVGTQVPVFLLLAGIANPYWFAASCCWILFCYGGGFGTMPSFTADTFGPRNIGSIYGVILIAWGCAGVVGPMLLEHIMQTSNNIAVALQLAACLLALGFILVLLYRKPKFSKP